MFPEGREVPFVVNGASPSGDSNCGRGVSARTGEFNYVHQIKRNCYIKVFMLDRIQISPSLSSDEIQINLTPSSILIKERVLLLPKQAKT